VLYLSGGGDGNDSIRLDKQFAKQFEGSRVLYLPIAMSGISPTYGEYSAWVQSVFNPLGITDIVMWDTLKSHLVDELKSFDAIYIGGGNTFKLLDDLRKTGFDSALKDFIINCGTVYGGSAGAIVLGRDIATCSGMDSNDVGIVDTSGFGLIGNYAIWCHYIKEHDSLISTYDYPILAIPERSGITFDGSVISVIGFDSVTVFDNHKKILLPNSTMAVLLN